MGNLIFDLYLNNIAHTVIKFETCMCDRNVQIEVKFGIGPKIFNRDWPLELWKKWEIFSFRSQTFEECIFIYTSDMYFICRLFTRIYRTNWNLVLVRWFLKKVMHLELRTSLEIFSFRSLTWSDAYVKLIFNKRFFFFF